MGRQHFSPQKRTDLLTAYVESGLTLKTYATANGIGYSTIQRWLKNYKTPVTDTVFSVKATTMNAHAQLSAVDPGYTHTSSSPVDFLDITPHLVPPSIFAKTDRAKNTKIESNDTAPVFSPVCGTHDASTMNAEQEKSYPLSAPPLCDKLDVFLPNGIRITLYQSGIDARTQLIKALV